MTKILIVEDNDIAGKLMGMILVKAGCKADIALDGIEAMKLFFSNKYDLIFMDIGLPDLSGLTVTKLIKEYTQYKNYSPIIIALTAHSDIATKEACLKIGMTEFLTKPVDNDRIVQIINALQSTTY